MTAPTLAHDLTALAALDGPAGGEEAVATALATALAPHVDRVRRDALGNVIAERAPRPAPGAIDGPAPVLWLTAGLDEPTLHVARLDPGGLVRFVPVGGVDIRAWLGQPVTVHGRRPLPGVIGTRPPHVLDAAQRDATPAVDDLFVDLGLGDEDARAAVQIGDAITLRRPPVALAAGRTTGKAVGRRAALAALVAAARALAAVDPPCALRFVGAVQSGLGLRGGAALGGGAGEVDAPPDARTGGDTARPIHAALALATTAAAQRGVEAGPALGGGPAIGRGPNVHPRLFERFVDAAGAHEIAHQVEALPALAPSEAAVLQIAGRGVATACLALPVRYGGTAAEVVAVVDAERAARLVAAVAVGFDAAAAAALRPALGAVAGSAAPAAAGAAVGPDRAGRS